MPSWMMLPKSNLLTSASPCRFLAPPASEASCCKIARAEVASKAIEVHWIKVQVFISATRRLEARGGVLRVVEQMDARRE